MGFGAVARRLLPRDLYESLIFRLTERRRARQDVPAEVGAGPPLPPPYLRVLVAGDADGPEFLARGEAIATVIADLAERHGLDLDAGPAVLDWGCGCGRIARWVAPRVEAAGGRFTGSDLNPALARWCQANLPGRYVSNGLRPPLRVAAASQDLLYAFSVATHLSLPVTRLWLAELRRVLKPGGLALVTFHDEDWPCPDPGALHRDGFYQSTRSLEGSNHMASYATRARFTELCGEQLEVLEIVPSNVGRQMQAWAVLRRP